MLFPHTSPEESLAAVTAGGTVVLARGSVPADGTVGVHLHGGVGSLIHLQSPGVRTCTLPALPDLLYFSTIHRTVVANVDREIDALCHI